jgi:hypothetical protein
MAHRRPLGRGLEQLSRAFLTEPAPERTGPEASAPAAPEPQPREPRPLPRRELGASRMLLLPPAQATRERIVAALRELAGDLEPGLRILDELLPCEPCGTVDLVALDGANRLVVLDVESAPGDELLVRGLGHLDWMIGNVALLRRQFRGQPINFSTPPRLFLLAPAFSARVCHAVRQAAGAEVELIRYHLAQTPAGIGIFLERLPAD